MGFSSCSGLVVLGGFPQGLEAVGRQGCGKPRRRGAGSQAEIIIAVANPESPIQSEMIEKLLECFQITPADLLPVFDNPLHKPLINMVTASPVRPTTEQNPRATPISTGQSY